MQFWTNVSVFGTLMLFLAYIVGRLITIFIERKLKHDVLCLGRTDQPSESLMVLEVYTISDGGDCLVITPDKHLNWVSVFEYDFCEKTGKFTKGAQVLKHSNLPANRTILVHMPVPCGMPQFILEYERYDYMKGVFVVAYNGRHGVLDNDIMLEHTWKSVIYYLVR